MQTDLTKLSIAEIRRRYLDPQGSVAPQVLRALQKDPRNGVREIHARLRRRHEQDKAERARIDALLNFERVLWRSGVEHVAGVDEVGVGPLAGPVVAAAVIFPPSCELTGVDDSKRLDARRRQELDEAIRKQAVAVAIGRADVDEIDSLNIYQAALVAMRRAVEGLSVAPEHVLVDARTIPGIDVPQNQFQKGDGINYSIAGASIVAKTYRDRLMEDYDREFPGYGFANHKGYGTPEHQAAIRDRGPSPIHRKSFTVIRELCGEYSRSFYLLKENLDAAGDAQALRDFEARLDGERGELGESEFRKLRIILARRWRTLSDRT